MSLFEALLIVHILAAMIWFGGALVGVLIGQLLRKQGDAGAMGKFCTAFATIAGPAFGGSGLLVIITGAWMVSEGNLDFGALWVSLSMGLWLVTYVMGATVVGMSWTKIGKRLNAGESLDELAPAFATALRWSYLDLALRLVILVLMVTQPV